MGHVTHMNESCQDNLNGTACVMTRTRMRVLESFICVTILLRMCDTTHSYVRHDSFVYATWRICICDVTPYVMLRMWMRHATHMDGSGHTYTRTHTHTHTHTHKDEACHTYNMSHVTHMTESCHIYKWVMSHIRTSHVTHMTESYQLSLFRNESCHKHMNGSCYIAREALQPSATYFDTLQHTATRCNTPQQTATHCNALACHATATHWRTRQP